MMNRLANCMNEYQGRTRRVLCVCSAGLLRSPTAAVVLSQEPYNFNTRAAGLNLEYALIPVDEVLIKWADEIVVMEKKMLGRFEKCLKPVIVLDIEDCFAYRDPQLVQLIKEKYDSYKGSE